MIALLALALAGEPPADEVHVSIDLQGHPAMHIPWNAFFGRGLTDRPLRKRTWRHMLRQQVSEPVLRESGVRIFLAAAMAAERARNPKQARRLIERQLDYVETFVAEHPEHYALARTPAEVRALVATTDKLVFVHSIEGGHHLLWEDEDVAHWAARGVAVFTLIHLRDKEFGASAVLDQAAGPLINPKGARKKRRGEPRGLTELGRQRMVDLWQAGVVVDLSHMAPEAVDDALELAAEAQIQPVFTHGKLDLAKPDDAAISADQLVELYRLGGLFATGLSAEEVGIEAPPAGAPEGVCWGTLEAFAWHHELLRETLYSRRAEIFGDAVPDELGDAHRTRLAVGWSSDWNGWLSHSRPVYGRGACRDLASQPDPRPIDTIGVAHPGVLPDHWQRVEEGGTELDPFWRSAERFLQIWETARGERPLPAEGTLLKAESGQDLVHPLGGE